MECWVGQKMMLTQCPSHGALYVRSHDTYMCFYMYGSPNKHVVIVSLARLEAQDRNNITLNFEEIWMLSRKNIGLIASIIKEYQTDSISKIFPSFRLRDKIIQVKSRWCLKWLVNGFWSNFPRSNTVELYSLSNWFWSMIFPKTTLSNVKTSWQSFWFLAHTLHNSIQLNRYSQKHFSTIFLY